MANAREMLNNIPRFQEGGEVTQEDSPDLAKALAVLESDPLKYKSMYQYLLTKGDIANLNDQNLAKEDIAALGLVHAARLSNTEPEAFIENLRPSMQNLPSKRQDVRPNVMLQGSSGGFNIRMPGMNFDMPYIPATLMGRLGAEADIGQDTVRAGLVAGGAYIPNRGVMRSPVRADVGYRTPFAGGSLNVGVSTGLQNPSAKNTNVMAHYSRRFAEGGEVEIPEEQALPSTEAAKSLAQYKQTAAPATQTQSVTPQFVMDGAALTRVAESGNNYNVGFNRAGTSDAFGAYQILSSTYKGIQAEDPYFLNKKQTSLTPEEQDRANQVLRNMNSRSLLARNVEATEPNLQLAHFLGPKGAALFLKDRYISPAAAAANGGLKKAQKIADQRLAMGRSIQEQTTSNAPSAPPTQEPPRAAPAAPMARQTASAALSPVDPPTKAVTFSANDDLARSIAAFKVATQPPKTKKPSIAGKAQTTKKRYAEGGEVTDEFPEEAGAMPDQNMSEAAKQMLFYKKTAAPTPPTDIARLGKQAGLIGLGFAPGAGVADYFGKFPAVEGGTEPSAVENFQKGNYGTAALQGLGAMGDLAMAVPVAGAAIGSVMKAPRAAQRILSSSTTAKDDLAKVPKELKGSTVVDQSGEPLTVYHGTNTKNLKEFDTTKKGAWFSEDQYIAEAYTRREGADAGTIISAKINVKNPLVVPQDIDMSKRYSVEEIINRINDDNATTYVPKDFGLKPNTEVPAFDVVSSPRFIKELKKGGFDGIKAYEGGYSTWNVFDNKQITSD